MLNDNNMYNQMHGENKDAVALLGMIGCTREMFCRYRDTYICDNGNNIIVYTRLGGSNRPDYKETIEIIRTNPNYLEDYDDDFDETYAYFKFKVPENYLDTTKKMYKGEPETIKQKFDRELEDMNKPGTEAYERAQRMAKFFENAINNDDGSNGNMHIISWKDILGG